MILESRLQVGLGRMARIAGFGEQHEIGQAESFDQGDGGRAAFSALFPQTGGIDESEAEAGGGYGKQEQGAIGGAHQ